MGVLWHVMQIILLAHPRDGVVAREQVGDSLEGEFILTEDGSIQYRHEEAGVSFAHLSMAQFVACVEAWDRYRRDVVKLEDEDAQLEVVRILERELREQGAFEREGFWTSIYEQAEWGHL